MSFGAMVVLFAIGQPMWGAGALAFCVGSLLWPSSEGIQAGANLNEGLHIDAKRSVESPFVIEDATEPSEKAPEEPEGATEPPQQA